MEQTTKKTGGRGIYLLPNLFTVSALFAGFYAIVAALKGHYDNAAIAIFIAMVMDNLDGRVARLTQTVTPFGAELDSLSDMVAFGIAPSLVVYSWTLSNLGKYGWLAAFVFTAAVALRLARFNIKHSKDNRHYQGLPCPPAAAVLAAIVWTGKEFEVPGHGASVAIAIFTVLLGVLMVSNVRYRSFKDFDLRSHVPFVVILAIVLAIIFISIDPPKVLLALSVIFAASGPAAALWQLLWKRKDEKSAKSKPKIHQKNRTRSSR